MGVCARRFRRHSGSIAFGWLCNGPYGPKLSAVKLETKAKPRIWASPKGNVVVQASLRTCTDAVQLWHKCTSCKSKGLHLAASSFMCFPCVEHLVAKQNAY